MASRAEFAQLAIINFYRENQRMPEIIQMHPVFARAVESESAWTMGRTNFCDGRDVFAGIPVEITCAVHSCLCLMVKP